jgi:hypothetical protein
MQSQNYDFQNIDLTNKEERNIFIGKEQRNNKYLSSFLNQSISSLVDYYLTINKIDSDDIIFRQKDGFILRKPLVISDQFIEMKLRSFISLMFVSLDRTRMLYFDDFGDLVVKGVKYYYKKLDDIYNMMYNLNFYNLKILFQQLAYIKNKVLTCDDISFYGIDIGDGKYVFLTKTGTLTVRDFDFVDMKSIDRLKYFNVYFKPFIDSVFLEVLRK